MNIPESFRLANRKWTVRRTSKLPKGVYGQTDPDTSEILLNSRIRRPALLEHTFLHELCHAIAMTLAWSKLNANEDKIDALAGMLHQYMKTQRGSSCP